jgi:hypothetical protein
MSYPYHLTQPYYDQLQAQRHDQTLHGHLKPHIQPLSSSDQPKPLALPLSSYSHHMPPYGQIPPSYGNSELSAMIQPRNPPNHPPVDVNSDFAKVWAACVDSYSSAQVQRMQQQMAQYSLHRPTTPTQQDLILQPSAEIHAKVSRWSQAIPHPPLPVPHQCLRAYEHPPRPDPPRLHTAQKSAGSHQESVPQFAPRPVPEANPLHRTEVLESPVALFQAPPKRGRNWPMPSNRVRVPTTSAQLLSQVTSPPHPTRVAGPVVNTMKRGHDDDSPMVHTSPEDELDTPPDDPMGLLLKQQVKRLPGSTDWIDDSQPHLCGDNQSKPCQTPTHDATYDRCPKTPFNNAHMVTAANALVKMYQGSKTDYSQPSQVSPILSYRYVR